MERTSPPPGHFPPQHFPYLIFPQQFDYQRDRFLAAGRETQPPPFISMPNARLPTPAPPSPASSVPAPAPAPDPEQPTTPPWPDVQPPPSTPPSHTHPLPAPAPASAPLPEQPAAPQPSPLHMPGGPSNPSPAAFAPPPLRPSPAPTVNYSHFPPDQSVMVYRATRTIIKPGLPPLSETRFSKTSSGMRESLVTTVGRNVSVRVLFYCCLLLGGD